MRWRRPTPDEARRDAERWRDALLATLSTLPDVPVLLSGGMDSMSVLAGLVTLGRKPACVTYRLDGAYSEDMSVAIRITRDLGVPHHAVLIDPDPRQLRADVERAIRVVGTRKTRVECAVPMFYLARYVNRALGASSAFVGDPGIIEDIRAYQVATNASGGVDTPAMRELRLRGYGEVGPGSAAMREAAARYGVDLIGPFAHEPIASTGLGLEPYAINYPRQKGIALRAFPDIFGDGRLPTPTGYRYWKPNKSLQTASGYADAVRRAFDIDSPRKMVGVYNDIARRQAKLPKEVPWA